MCSSFSSLVLKVIPHCSQVNCGGLASDEDALDIFNNSMYNAYYRYKVCKTQIGLKLSLTHNSNQQRNDFLKIAY